MKLLELQENGTISLNLPPDIAGKLGWQQSDIINIWLVEDAIFLTKITPKSACCEDNFEDLTFVRL